MKTQNAVWKKSPVRQFSMLKSVIFFLLLFNLFSVFLLILHGFDFSRMHF